MAWSLPLSEPLRMITEGEYQQMKHQLHPTNLISKLVERERRGKRTLSAPDFRATSPVRRAPILSATNSTPISGARGGHASNLLQIPPHDVTTVCKHDSDLFIELPPIPTFSNLSPSPSTLSDLEEPSASGDSSPVAFFDFSAWKGLRHWRKRLNKPAPVVEMPGKVKTTVGLPLPPSSTSADSELAHSVTKLRTTEKTGLDTIADLVFTFRPCQETLNVQIRRLPRLPSVPGSQILLEVALLHDKAKGQDGRRQQMIAKQTKLAIESTFFSFLCNGLNPEHLKHVVLRLRLLAEPLVQLPRVPAQDEINRRMNLSAESLFQRGRSCASADVSLSVENLFHRDIAFLAQAPLSMKRESGKPADVGTSYEHLPAGDRIAYDDTPPSVTEEIVRQRVTSIPRRKSMPEIRLSGIPRVEPEEESAEGVSERRPKHSRGDFVKEAAKTLSNIVSEMLPAKLTSMKNTLNTRAESTPPSESDVATAVRKRQINKTAAKRDARTRTVVLSEGYLPVKDFHCPKNKSQSHHGSVKMKAPHDFQNPISKLFGSTFIGKVLVSLQYQRLGRRIKVSVTKASGLPMTAPTKPEYLMRVELAYHDEVEENRFTCTVPGDCPEWNSSFIFLVAPLTEPPTTGQQQQQQGNGNGNAKTEQTKLQYRAVRDHTVRLFLLRRKLSSVHVIGAVTLATKQDNWGFGLWDKMMMSPGKEVEGWQNIVPLFSD